MKWSQKLQNLLQSGSGAKRFESSVDYEHHLCSKELFLLCMPSSCLPMMYQNKKEDFTSRVACVDNALILHHTDLAHALFGRDLVHTYQKLHRKTGLSTFGILRTYAEIYFSVQQSSRRVEAIEAGIWTRGKDIVSRFLCWILRSQDTAQKVLS